MAHKDGGRPTTHQAGFAVAVEGPPAGPPAHHNGERQHKNGEQGDRNAGHHLSHLYVENPGNKINKYNILVVRL